MSTESTEKQANPWIVTVTPTIMDGTVVRWHKTLYQAEAVEPMISASRNMVSIRFADMRTAEEIAGFQRLFTIACSVHDRLRRGARYDDLECLATHKADGFGGVLKPVVAEPVGGDRDE